MDGAHDRTASERRRREGRIWRGGLAASVLFHLLVFLLWRGEVLPPPATAAAGPPAGDARAAPGGGAGAMQVLTLRSAQPQPVETRPVVRVEPMPVPVPVEVELELEVEPLDFDQLARIEPPSGLAELLGPGGLPGLATGDGRGGGGDAESGLHRMEPPSPRGMIIPPSNRELKGTQVQVWVFVDETGRVVADSTRLDPPTRDGDFNRRLIREAAEWVFRPAQQAGRPVAAWFPYRISM
ncbi:MAG TPA: hypothetical protein VFQ22_02495 [Longimicrobiales bacterium]|nr:hypothetical protein [Longimicrobiales bacterium]